MLTMDSPRYKALPLYVESGLVEVAVFQHAVGHMTEAKRHLVEGTEAEVYGCRPAHFYQSFLYLAVVYLKVAVAHLETYVIIIHEFLNHH